MKIEVKCYLCGHKFKAKADEFSKRGFPIYFTQNDLMMYDSIGREVLCDCPNCHRLISTYIPITAQERDYILTHLHKRETNRMVVSYN